jgi:hypothetical protein
MRIIIETAAAIVLLAIATNALSEPADGDSNDNQGGRYRIIAVSEGNFSSPYVIDTKTGRVWRQVLDSENHTFLFVSMTYQNIDRQLSKVPNETATDVFLKSRGNDSKIDDLKKLQDEYQTLLGEANNQTLSIEEREKRKKSAEDKFKQIKQLQQKTNEDTTRPFPFQQKLDDDMKKLFPNANQGGNTNSP